MFGSGKGSWDIIYVPRHRLLSVILAFLQSLPVSPTILETSEVVLHGVRQKSSMVSVKGSWVTICTPHH
jgi:hypothetical protein